MLDKQRPLVSVAIITYNQKDFLRECIESILSQDYENIEIVVADDASSDGTQEMLKEYEAKHPGRFVLCLAQKNQGITPNSNTAHFACTGKYIAWMGGDDLMLPGKIRKQVEYLETHPNCSICYHNAIAFHSDTGEEIKFPACEAPRVSFLKEMVKYGCFIGACTAMLRRESAPKHGFDKRVPIASDWLYWVETLYGGGSADRLEENLSKHRRHDNNVTSNNRDNFRIHLWQDHITSCALIATQKPFLYSEVKYREAYLYRSLRWNKGENYYRQYLMISMRKHFMLSTFGAYVLSFFGVKK